MFSASTKTIPLYAALFSAGMFACLQWFPVGAMVLFAIIVVLWCVYRPTDVLYAFVATCMFIGWDVWLGKYLWLRQLPIVPTINAPLGDFFAIALLITAGIVLFRTRGKWLRVQDYAPGILWYGGFLLVALFAAMHAFEGMVVASLYYTLRFMLFAYAVYVVAFLILVKDSRTLLRVLHILFWVGVSIAVFGVLSLFQPWQSGFYRVAPFYVFGIAPLGVNHNIMAEALVAIIPFAVFVALRQKQAQTRWWYMAAVALMVLITLLTLSRAAWISFFCMTVIVTVVFPELRMWVRSLGTVARTWCVFLAMACVVYMAIFLGSSVVDSSNSSRVAMTQMAVFYALEQPVLGYGPGMFMRVLEDTRAYVMDFGDPLDAHGFIQKITVETGVLGLVFFVGFLVYVLWSLGQRLRVVDRYQIFFVAAFLSVSGSVLFQLFNTSYFQSHMWLPIGIGLSGLNIVRRREQMIESRGEEKD